MIVRAAVEEDLASIRDIASAYGNLADWPRRPDYLDHELSRGTLAVCEVDGRVAGFGGVLERSPVTHLADLFVRPDLLGRGIGKALLNRLLPAEGPRVTFASKDPRALPLYVRFGMRPLAPLIHVAGSAQACHRLPDPGVKLVETEPRALVELDRNASSRDRLQDLEFLQLQAGARGFLAHRGTRPIGYGLCRLVDGSGSGGTGAFIGPAGAPDGPDAAATVLALLRWTADQASESYLSIFGPTPVLSTVLREGFRVREMDTFMSSDEGLIDMRRYFPTVELG